MEFKAEKINGEIQVKPIIEKKTNATGGTDVIVHMPSFPLIQKLQDEHGKRDIQQI